MVWICRSDTAVTHDKYSWAHCFNIYFVDVAEYTHNIHRGAKIYGILPSNESERLMTQKI